MFPDIPGITGLSLEAFSGWHLFSGWDLGSSFNINGPLIGKL